MSFEALLLLRALARYQHVLSRGRALSLLLRYSLEIRAEFVAVAALLQHRRFRHHFEDRCHYGNVLAS